MPTIEIARKDCTNPKSKWLLGFSSNEFSQFGEDGIIQKCFGLIGRRSSWCFEAGAWDGKYLSNTHALMKQGWHGVFVEGNPQKMKDLRETYADNPRAHLINALVGADVGIDALLSTTPIPTDFDLLSLDIDGLDYYAWQSITKYRPRIVVVEFNPTIPNDVVFIQDRDMSLNQGCSLLALIQLGKQKGYELVAVTDVNAIFVVREEFRHFRIKDNSINAMFFDKWAARIFQGYDGTIFTAGMPFLLWSNHKIDFEDLQVLPPEKRRFADAPPS